MNEENYITVFNTNSVDEVEGLVEQLRELEKTTKVNITSGQMGAVIGESAGKLIEILISPQVQSLINLYTVGSILLVIIVLLQKAGKKIHIGKYIAKLMLAAKTKNDSVADNYDNRALFEKAKIFGPMEIDTLSESLYRNLPPTVEALTPYAFFMATVIPIARDRARTYWYILRNDGLVLANWTSQTFISRLPDFLKPL